MRPKCLFCDRDGHTIEKCFNFQGKPYEERKSIVNTRRLCNLCLCKGHFASNCKRSRGCFISGWGKRHHPMLHPAETAKDGKKDVPENQNEEIKLDPPRSSNRKCSDWSLWCHWNYQESCVLTSNSCKGVWQR